MRVGLFSPHYAFNYGAVLQAFALKEYLIDNGYDAAIINRRPEYQCAIPSFMGRIARRIEEFAKRNSFGKFEKTFLQPQTERIIFQSDWQKFPELNLDAVIVGSDQVWRDDYTFNSFGFNLFLDFIKDEHTLRIAYAPSLGKDSWNASKDVEDKVKFLLKKFDSISVREDTSIGVLKSKFDVDSTLVVDPTMLLTAQKYLEKLNFQTEKKRKYIAAYILDYDERYRNVLRRVSEILSMPVRKIVVKKSMGKFHEMISRFSPMRSVTDWVKNIANSDYVITNSFHGMVFSIIFRKQFLVFMNSDRGGARFMSLLKMFGLQDRLVNISDEIYLERLNEIINYSDDVDYAIQQWRKHSEEYLRKSLQSK